MLFPAVPVLKKALRPLESTTLFLLLSFLMPVSALAATIENDGETSGKAIDIVGDIQHEQIAEYFETGVPNCALCHAQDKRPAIDYSNDPECLQCHSSDYSQRFLDIDSRYKVSSEDMAYKVAMAEPSDKPAAAQAGIPSTKHNIPEGMVLIPAGEFTMGTNDWWPKSGPEHKRHLPDYYMDKYEVTNARYKKFVKAAGHQLPDHWVKQNNEIPKGEEEFPVVFVSWRDAHDYCQWAGKRLPTEFEWEKAARGTDARVFPWGNEFDKNKGNTPQYGLGKTMKVGSFDNGKSPYGLYDMAGNVFEWTASWYKSYPGNTHKDPNEGEIYRVVKGGSWYDCTYYRCGISAPTYNRIFFHPMTKNFSFGFRCAKDP